MKYENYTITAVNGDDRSPEFRAYDDETGGAELNECIAEMFREGVFRNWNSTEEVMDFSSGYSKGVLKENHGVRLEIRCGTETVSNRFYSFDIKDDVKENSDTAATDIIGHEKGNIVWDGSAATLERLKEKFGSEYDIVRDGNELFVSWTKCMSYVIGEQVPDEFPAGD